MMTMKPLNKTEIQLHCNVKAKTASIGLGLFHGSDHTVITNAYVFLHRGLSFSYVQVQSYKMQVHYLSLYHVMATPCELTVFFSTSKYKAPMGILSLHSTKGVDVFLTAQKVNRSTNKRQQTLMFCNSVVQFSKWWMLASAVKFTQFSKLSVCKSTLFTFMSGEQEHKNLQTVASCQQPSIS